MGVAEQSTTAAGSRDRLPPVPDAGGRVRRRRPGSVLAPMLVAGLLLGLASYMVLRDQEATYRVAVPAADLRAGSVVSTDSFRLVETKVADELAAGLLHADDLARVDGWVAANSLPAGELVSRSDLRPPSAPHELRAMSVPIARERAAGGDLSRGDRVDVIAVVDGRAFYVAADLEILAVASGGGEGALQAPGRFFVTVAVDEDTALALAQALEIGAVSVLRSTGSLPATVDPEAVRELTTGRPGTQGLDGPSGETPAPDGVDSDPMQEGDDGGNG